MRPLSGIVIGTNKKTGLRIKLESGLIASLPYDKKYNMGQKLLIMYDFTKNTVKGIFNPKMDNMLELIEHNFNGEDNDPENPERIELLGIN